jgi:hypothetical protein
VVNTPTGFGCLFDPEGDVRANLEKTQPTCGRTTTAGNTGGALFPQVLCDAGLAPCPAGGGASADNARGMDAGSRGMQHELTQR